MSIPAHRPRFAYTSAIAAAALALLLAGCGSKKESVASQTAAKVNKQEITVHQINYILQQQRGIRPEQMDQAQAQILERLIDQEIAIQQADDLKLERDPRVIQQIEAAKREIIARAYIEHLGDSATKPTPAEVEKYYNERPAMFKDRRVYRLMEIAIEAKPEQVQGLAAKLGELKNVGQFGEYLKANSIKFNENGAVRTPEQLPPDVLDQLAKMKDGQAVLRPTPGGAQVIVLAESRPQPATLQQATAAIEQLITADRRRELVLNKFKQLREASKIEYVGKFHAPASGAAATEAASGAAATEAASAPALPPASGPAAGNGLDAASITKGLGSK